jgi:hypothetical protein
MAYPKTQELGIGELRTTQYQTIPKRVHMMAHTETIALSKNSLSAYLSRIYRSIFVLCASTQDHQSLERVKRLFIPS